MIQDFKNSFIVIKILTFPCVNLEVAGKLSRLHSEELYDFCSSPNIMPMIKSRRMRWVWHVARVGERRDAYVVLVGRLKGKRSLGRHRNRWKNNIKMDLQELGRGRGPESSDSGQGRMVVCCEDGYEPSVSIKCAGVAEEVEMVRKGPAH